MVVRLLPKQELTGSIPVYCSISPRPQGGLLAHEVSMVRRRPRSAERLGSIPRVGFRGTCPEVGRHPAKVELMGSTPMYRFVRVPLLRIIPIPSRPIVPVCVPCNRLRDALPV